MTLGTNKLVMILSCLLLAFSVSACSSTSRVSTSYESEEISDPFEATNRVVFAFNNFVDDALIHPLGKGYKAVVPEPARNGVSNFLRNLSSPVRFVNQLLQGDLGGAGNELFRTVVNTLVGVGGVFDVAGYEGYEHEPEDFGQTLAVWGVGEGPYFVVPFLGPSNLRDSTGFMVDGYADPLRHYLFNTDREAVYWARTGADYFDLRVSLIDLQEDLESNSIDYYAAVRSIYSQRRNAMIRDDDPEASAEFDIPDFDDDF